jgi:hypothetical protein
LVYTEEILSIKMMALNKTMKARADLAAFARSGALGGGGGIGDVYVIQLEML